MVAGVICHAMTFCRKRNNGRPLSKALTQMRIYREDEPEIEFPLEYLDEESGEYKEQDSHKDNSIGGIAA